MPVFYINSRTKYGKNVLVGMSGVPILAKRQNKNNNQNSFNSHLQRAIPIGLIIKKKEKKKHFPVHNFVKLTFASTFRMMPKLCARFDFRVKRTFNISHVASYAAPNSCRCRFPRMTSFQGQSGQEENNFCFWFLTDSW